MARMFTGIVTDIGLVREIEPEGDTRLRIGTRYDPEGIDIGASISCDGICLTVVDRGRSDDSAEAWFDVQASAETLLKTTMGEWEPGRRINLERALKVGDELGGHIVSGHIDGRARVVSVSIDGDSTRVVFEAPEALAPFIAPKGSVALNGTSLTVNEVEGTRFGVNLIPHTKVVTTWGDIGEGDHVNLEIDTMARYVERLQSWNRWNR
jgi:riboflavin synthase